MKDRPKAFLAHLYVTGVGTRDDKVGDYISELHGYLWRFVRIVMPGAGGSLNEWLDDAVILAAAKQIEAKWSIRGQYGTRMEGGRDGR